jgi:hypothetical protein
MVHRVKIEVATIKRARERGNIQFSINFSFFSFSKSPFASFIKSEALVRLYRLDEKHNKASLLSLIFLREKGQQKDIFFFARHKHTSKGEERKTSGEASGWRNGGKKIEQYQRTRKMYEGKGKGEKKKLQRVGRTETCFSLPDI